MIAKFVDVTAKLDPAALFGPAYNTYGDDLVSVCKFLSFEDLSDSLPLSIIAYFLSPVFPTATPLGNMSSLEFDLGKPNISNSKFLAEAFYLECFESRLVS